MSNFGNSWGGGGGAELTPAQKKDFDEVEKKAGVPGPADFGDATLMVNTVTGMVYSKDVGDTVHKVGGADVSTDEANSLVFGEDNGLYVPSLIKKHAGVPVSADFGNSVFITDTVTGNVYIKGHEDTVQALGHYGHLLGDFDGVPLQADFGTKIFLKDTNTGAVYSSDKYGNVQKIGHRISPAEDNAIIEDGANGILVHRLIKNNNGVPSFADFATVKIIFDSNTGIPYIMDADNNVKPVGAGDMSFLQLSDTINSYATHALKIIRVNAAQDGTEAVTLSAAIEKYDDTISQFGLTAVNQNTQKAIEKLKQLIDGTPDQIVKADIAERDAAGALPNGTIAHVEDATADPSITAGWCKYQRIDDTWFKYLAQEDLSALNLEDAWSDPNHASYEIKGQISFKQINDLYKQTDTMHDEIKLVNINFDDDEQVIEFSGKPSTIAIFGKGYSSYEDDNMIPFSDLVRANAAGEVLHKTLGARNDISTATADASEEFNIAYTVRYISDTSIGIKVITSGYHEKGNNFTTKHYPINKIIARFAPTQTLLRLTPPTMAIDTDGIGNGDFLKYDKPNSKFVRADAITGLQSHYTTTTIDVGETKTVTTTLTGWKTAIGMIFGDRATPFTIAREQVEAGVTSYDAVISKDGALFMSNYTITNPTATSIDVHVESGKYGIGRITFFK